MLFLPNKVVLARLRTSRVGFWKVQQLFAVIFVLSAAQGDFTRQAFADGVGQGVEFVENSDDAGLFGERRDGDFERFDDI